ncbi:hypothetical protein E4T56_gene17533, partial [Termitomyces sp. T112]
LFSINYSDFAREIWGSLHFFFTGKTPSRDKMNFGNAFGLDGYSHTPGRNNVLVARNPAAMPSYDEHIHLSAYESRTFQETPRASMQERYTDGPNKSL